MTRADHTFLRQITLGDVLQIVIGIGAVSILFWRVNAIELATAENRRDIRELTATSIRLTTIIEKEHR